MFWVWKKKVYNLVNTKGTKLSEDGNTSFEELRELEHACCVFML